MSVKSRLIKENKGIHSNLSQNSFPQPKKVKCECGKSFLVKFVISQQAWSKKNNWGYWTEKEENQEIYKCGSCLRQLFSDKINYWSAVKSSKKRALFRVYLSNNSF